MPANEKRLSDLPNTRRSLLTRLKDWDDAESWREFFDTFGMLIYRFSLKAGLKDTESQDVVQETLLAVDSRVVDPGHHSDAEREPRPCVIGENAGEQNAQGRTIGFGGGGQLATQNLQNYNHEYLRNSHGFSEIAQTPDQACSQCSRREYVSYRHAPSISTARRGRGNRAHR